MAVYYFEGERILAPLTISSNEPIYDADTISLKKQRSSQGAQRWELSFTITSEDPSNLLVNTIAGFSETNTMVMPQLKTVEDRLTAAGIIPLVSDAAAGSTSVSVARTSATGLIPKGYFIKFNTTSNKVYMLLNDLNLNGTGSVTANIYPSLVEDLVTNDEIVFGSNVEITYYRDISDIKGITYTDGLLSNPGTINIIEAL